MKAAMYVNKAELFLKRKMFDKVIESLGNAIKAAKDEDDFAELMRANCFLGEISFMQKNYEQAKECLTFVTENSRKAEEQYDDLLNDEIYESNLLLSLLEKYEE